MKGKYSIIIIILVIVIVLVLYFISHRRTIEGMENNDVVMVISHYN